MVDERVDLRLAGWPGWLLGGRVARRVSGLVTTWNDD